MPGKAKITTTVIFIIVSFAFGARLKPEASAPISHAETMMQTPIVAPPLLENQEVSSMLHMTNELRTSVLSGLTGLGGGNVYTVAGGFWRTDGGFVSTLRIKNNLVVAPLVVRPTLYMADGTRYPLAPVLLSTGGIGTININNAITQAASAIPGHISEFGTVDLTYVYASPGHIMAEVQALDVPRSLSLEYPLMEKWAPIATGPNTTVNNTPPPNGLQMVEGLWWKRDSGVSGSVSVTNTTNKEQAVSIELTGPARTSAPAFLIRLAAHASQNIALSQLGEESNLQQRSAGGVRIQYTCETGSVVVAGDLLNPSEGYSANMPFWWHDTMSKPSPMSYGAAGVLVGKPDPMMGFPGDTTFAPYLALRNSTAQRMKVAIEVNYLQGSTPISRSVTAMIGPGEARELEINKLMSQLGIKDFDGSINLGVSFTGRMGDLVLATGSADQSGTYVFEVRPQEINAGRSRIGDHWSIDDGNDTMISIWNPTTESENIEVTLLYGKVSGKYVIDVLLAPGASASLDLRMLENVPDKNGNQIAAENREGSVMFANADGANKPLRSVLALGVYNVVNGTCCGQCVKCCPYSNFTLDPGGFFIGVGGQMQCTCTATDCTGTKYNMGGTWSSSNTSVMTISSTGVVTARATGQATISDNIGTLVVGSACTSCPTGTPQPSTPGTVDPSVSISGAPGIPTGTTGNFSVNVGSNPDNVTITLALSTTSGSGKATFNDGTQSMTLTAGETVAVKGVTTSSTANNLTLTAKDPGGNTLASANFTVFWVTISTIYTSGPLQSDDDAANQYDISVGQPTLGNASAAFDGVEIKGTVQPTNFTDTINIKQTKISYSEFQDATSGTTLSSSYSCSSSDYTTCQVDDSGGGSNQDITPAPNGNIYTWDAPGVTLNSITNSPFVARIRQNFADFAIYGSSDTVASNVFTWSNANSVKRTSTGTVSFEATYDANGDNAAKSSSVYTTYCLKSSCP